MSRHTKYIQKMLDDLDNGNDYVESPDKLVSFKRVPLLYLNIYHYGTLILTIYCDGEIEIGAGAYSDTDVRIINQVLEHYKMEKIAHRHKDDVYLE